MTRRLAVTVAALTLLVAARRARADNQAQATEEMAKAEEHLERAEFDQAIARFKAARALVPSSSGPLFGLGIAYVRAGRCADGLPVLEEYLRKKGKSARPEAQAAVDDCQLRTSTVPGRVEIASDPIGAEVRFDSETAPVAGTTPFAGEHHAGAVRVFVTKPGYHAASSEVKLLPGKSVAVALKLTALPRMDELRPAGPGSPSTQYVPPQQDVPAGPAGKIIVDIAPVEATVTVNDTEVPGRTRRYEGPMVAGRYRVLVEHEGYRAVEADLTLNPGETVQKSVQLQPTRSGRWLGLGIPMTLVAVAAGAGAIACYVKANDLNNNPPSSGTPNDQIDTYNHAQIALWVVGGVALAGAVAGYTLYAITNRGKIADGPPLQVAVLPLRDGAFASAQLRF
jgi:hypothetical protein